MINIIYKDNDIVVCIKPSGVLSTDEIGGMPELIKNQLMKPDLEVKTVHRLDRITSGLMVYAIGSMNASILSKQIIDRQFHKRYLTIIHGVPELKQDILNDLLFRDKQKNMTYPVKRMRKGVRDASLEYNVLNTKNNMSLCDIKLLTGRTHQVRVQFSSRKMPVYGDTKYGGRNDNCQLALWSYNLSFKHPKTGEYLVFNELPPNIWPWNEFEGYTVNRFQDEYELSERKKYREYLYMTGEENEI